MIRDFSKEELLPARSETDTELTIGGGMLLGLGGGLLLLCAMCFGLGYMVGHRSSPDQQAAVASPLPVAKTPAAPAGAGTKPGAGEQAPVRPQAQSSTDSSGFDDGAQSDSARAESGVTQPQVKPVVESQVRPALGVKSGGTQPAPAFQVQSALKQTQGWMVQIAQVSQAEDAEVLVNALRKRGYTVAARRELSDNLIHVQTGPFVNRNDANAMRQKLLNDGYNAIVQ
jgi:cell division septation protein DedD